MRVRLAVATAIIAIVLVGIAVLRFTAPRPGPVASAIAVATPTATVEASPPPQSPTASAMPSVSPPPASPPPASSSPATSPSASPAAAPSPTQDPNLLTVANGAIIRRWTLGNNSPGAALLIDNGFLVDPGFNRPVEFEYELPSVAHIDRVGAIVRTKVPVTIRVAAGTSRDALRDAGAITVTGDASEVEKTLDVAIDARSLRFTVQRQPGNQIFIESIAAYGTPSAPESGSLAGWWISPDSPDAAGGAMFGSVKGSNSRSAAARCQRASTRDARARRTPRRVLLHHRCHRAALAWRHLERRRDRTRRRAVAARGRWTFARGTSRGSQHHLDS